MYAASRLDPKKRRLVRSLYRSMMRWCQELHPNTPLSHHVPPMQGKPVDNVNIFQARLRDEFRRQDSLEESSPERIQAAIQGLKKLNQILPELLKHSRQWGDAIAKHQKKKERENLRINNEEDNSVASGILDDESGWVKERLDTVQWLPRIEECEPQTLVDPYEEKFPLFPLRGPLFYQDNPPEGELPKEVALPLFTSPQDIPVPGMEVPLQIFEPRYRELYDDLQTSGNRQVVVPFAHPFIPNRFAKYALVHTLTNLKEIADETNGKVQYLADHVVTKPIYISAILNSQVWSAQETYLQVQGHFVDNDHVYHDVWEPLNDLLVSWKNETSHPLATKSLAALETEGLWAFVHIWNLHFQQELLHLQLGVATQVKRLAGISEFSVGSIERSNASAKMIARAQEPHRPRLLQLMLDTSLLVPTLLSLDGIGKCEHLMNMVDREILFQKTNSFK